MSSHTPRVTDGTNSSKRRRRRDLDNSGRTLRIARRAARLTQRQLAAKVGVDHSFISLIESGDRDWRGIGYETIVRLAVVLNVAPADLFPIRPFNAKGAA